jgi:hypothetical protein
METGNYFSIIRAPGNSLGIAWEEQKQPLNAAVSVWAVQDSNL